MSCGYKSQNNKLKKKKKCSADIWIIKKAVRACPAALNLKNYL